MESLKDQIEAVRKAAPPLPKRGTVLVDRLGQRWRVSNRGCAYEISKAGHRIGSHRYARLNYLADEYGPLVPERAEDEAPRVS